MYLFDLDAHRFTGRFHWVNCMYVGVDFLLAVSTAKHGSGGYLTIDAGATLLHKVYHGQNILLAGSYCQS